MDGLYVHVGMSASRWRHLPQQCKNGCVYRKAFGESRGTYCFVPSLNTKSQCAAVDPTEGTGSEYESGSGSGSMWIVRVQRVLWP